MSLLSMLPGVGLATSGAGLLTQLMNKPNYNKINYQTPAALQAAIDSLMNMPGYEGIFSGAQQASNAKIGRSRREGMRDIERSGAEGGAIAKYISDLYSNTASTAAETAGQNKLGAYNTAMQRSSTMGNLAEMDAKMKYDIAKYNTSLDMAKTQWWQDLGSGLGSLGAKLFEFGFNEGGADLGDLGEAGSVL